LTVTPDSRLLVLEVTISFWPSLKTSVPPLIVPPLSVQEPVVLKAFRDGEDAALHHYGWVDQGSQVVRLPIDRAKDLRIERGLPVRPAAAEAAPAATK